MNGSEYITIHMRLLEVGKILQTLDLDGFIRCVENGLSAASAAANPELYEKSELAFSAAKRLAESCQPVKTVFTETYGELKRSTPVGFMKLEANKTDGWPPR